MEELNQVQEENVFDDVTAEEENLFEDAEDTTETSEAEEAEEVSAEPFLTVRYDKEDRNLSQEEAKEYAQKGMNYDRLQGKYDDLNSRIDRLAKMNDLSVDEFLSKLDETQMEFMVSNELDSLKEQYPDTAEEVLRELASNRIKGNIESRQNHEKAEAEAQKEAEAQRQITNFLREYPDVSPDNVDQKVFDYIDQGYTLLEAYEKWQRESPQAKAEKQNEANKKRSLGSTTNAGKQDTDDFLSGFLNG